ncbi:MULTISPECIES: vWA domain-containing protein [Psychrilyobacter]|uniref:VWA domain-containing protein n=1 Tax=Psychrilyobacter piezotolerans TaxID=2293438 RepID=A0ABX9KJ52_9FUSO|nr:MULTISPECIES: vWA domain-containing protein [Psychrilyobacter]MCS5423030.1 VWA domain-containing protein [Psychrilyobacter sp. S5]NDI77205.1 VWA domain-containing protein [Psychrilyobacter piezotolerans]RDE64195.1 VWA domain-containing protein [Psychrilyobacter sp. S5]REI42287.1 VWA domain-containing protein [Psychrilyobacter piezotolerans]
MKKDYHEVICIIDRSGSMDEIKSDAIGGFNYFVKSQKEFEGETALSLILFNDNYNVVYDGKDIKEVPVLDEKNYIPNGRTAMLDAIGTTIDRVGERLYKTPEAERPEKVIVATLTDGLENASKEYSYQQIAVKVKLQQEMYNWEFIFLAANQDAVVAAEKIAIKQEDAVNFEASSKGTHEAFNLMGKMVSHKRRKNKRRKK